MQHFSFLYLINIKIINYINILVKNDSDLAEQLIRKIYRFIVDYSNEVGIDKDTGREIIKINPKFYRPSEVDLLLGDSSKAQKILGWNNETSFNDLLSMMIEADLIKAKKEI